MADIDPNFTCSDPELSHTNVTSEVWMILKEGPLHENGVLAIAICQTLIIAVGIPWNIIVLAFIMIKKHYKEPTYILLMNLVLADLLACSCVLPFNIVSAFTMEFSIGSSDYVRCQVCHTIAIVTVALIFISLFTQALMALDRLVYIKWPIKYEKKITKCRTISLLVGVWVLCIFISLPPVFGIGEIKFANIFSSCTLLTVGETRITANINYVFFLALVGFVAFMTTLIVNTWLLAIVSKSVRQRHKKTLTSNKGRIDSETLRRNSESKFKTDYHKKQILLAKVFGAIFIANVATWVPSIFILMVSAIVRIEQINPLALIFVYLTYICQPAIHPVLETCLIGKVKMALFKFLCFCKRKPNRRHHCTSRSIRKVTPNSSVAVSLNVAPPQ